MNILNDILKVEEPTYSLPSIESLLDISVESTFRELDITLGVIDALDSSFESFMAKEHVTQDDLNAYRVSCNAIILASGLNIPQEVLVSSFEADESAKGDTTAKKDNVLKRAATAVYETLKKLFKNIKDWLISKYNALRGIKTDVNSVYNRVVELHANKDRKEFKDVKINLLSRYVKGNIDYKELGQDFNSLVKLLGGLNLHYEHKELNSRFDMDVPVGRIVINLDLIKSLDLVKPVKGVFDAFTTGTKSECELTDGGHTFIKPIISDIGSSETVIRNATDEIDTMFKRIYKIYESNGFFNRAQYDVNSKERKILKMVKTNHLIYKECIKHIELIIDIVKDILNKYETAYK